jgi:hypothetical protein
MKYIKTFLIISVCLLSTLPLLSALAAGNIDAVLKYSQFLNTDINSDAVMDRINWNPTNGGVTVSDTTLVGDIWGETVGWISLDPTNGGVENTCTGDLSGSAWGQNTGWINFNPANGGVTIDPETGEFSGYAWAQNYGWINFACPGGNTCVTTSWRCSPPVVVETECEEGCIGTIDLCQNITDIQSVVPDGYYKVPAGNTVTGDCFLITSVTDLCLNIDGIQSVIPTGYSVDNAGNCTLPNDICPNLAGNQSVVPTGYSLDGNGLCIADVITTDDFCPNIADNQETIPNGYMIDDQGNCVLPDAPPTDACANLPGIQPEGTICVDTQPISSINGGNNILGGTMKVSPLLYIIPSIGLLAALPGLAPRIANLVFAIPFFRKRRPFGIVYDSKTKEPIDPAVITVYNTETNTVVDTRITDINGRYGFLLPKGTYRITAEKTHYQFPSQLLAHQDSDGIYNHLYYGETFTVSDEDKSAIINLNIPMDPLADDWNQQEKKRTNIIEYFTRNQQLWSRISLILFVLGFGFSGYILFNDPNVWNVIVFALYLVFTTAQLSGLGPVYSGKLTNLSGEPIPHAVIRVWNANLGNQVTQRITNQYGQYYILVAKGDYYITIDTKNKNDTFDRVYTSETMHIKNGVINQSIKLQ